MRLLQTASREHRSRSSRKAIAPWLHTLPAEPPAPSPHTAAAPSGAGPRQSTAQTRRPGPAQQGLPPQRPPQLGPDSAPRAGGGTGRGGAGPAAPHLSGAAPLRDPPPPSCGEAAQRGPTHLRVPVGGRAAPGPARRYHLLRLRLGTAPQRPARQRATPPRHVGVAAPPGGAEEPRP